MTLDEAKKLADRLRRYNRHGDRRFWTTVKEGPTERYASVDASSGRARPAFRKSARIVFHADDGAQHAIDVFASTPARAEAHWRNFVGDAYEPRVGQQVRMLRGAGGYHGSTSAKVVRLGRSRALVMFGYRTTNRITERWIPLEGLGWG